MKKLIIGLACVLLSASAVEIGKVPVEVNIGGRDGGKTDGTVWNSSMLKGKVYVLFYVDPDEKDLNKALTQALKKRHFSRTKYGSVAVVNLAATWKPNMIIEALLKKKQKEFPSTLYVKDKNKVLVKQWGLADDNSDILVFDKKGKLIYKKYGKLSSDEIKEVLALIEKNL